MDQNQETFLNFLLDRTSDENKDALRALMNDVFSKQDAGQFTLSDLLAAQGNILQLTLPEARSEIEHVFAQYGESA